MSDDLAVFQPVKLSQHFQITKSGLVINGNPSFEACEALWETLKTLETSLQFAIGDALRYFEKRWKDRASQIIDATGLSLSTVNVYRRTAENVPPENRMMDKGLTYSHHQAVATLPHRQQRKWLTEACSGDSQWSVARLKAAIKAGEDPEPTAWYVLVTCRSGTDQERFMKATELDGRVCKAITRRGAS